jgi:hypothetical protein
MSQLMLRVFLRGALGLLFSFSWVEAVETVESKTLPSEAVVEETTASLRQTAMPHMDSTRLGTILNRYYNESQGGTDVWRGVVSLRTSGTLTLESGEFGFNVYQKKPNYMKVTITGMHRRMQMGYDGKVAWRVVEQGEAVEMDAEQARRFIHGAHFGSFLLYPYAKGKTIEYIDTVPVDGKICHQIRVTLDSDYQVDCFLDIRSFYEVKVVNTDLRSGLVNSVMYDDFVREEGMPIARKIVSYDNDVLVSTVVLDEIKVNTGAMPWMFEMPK